MLISIKKLKFNKTFLISFILFTISGLILNIAVTFKGVFILFFLFPLYCGYYLLIKENSIYEFFVLLFYFLILSSYFYFFWTTVYAWYLIILAFIFWSAFFFLSFYVDYIVYKKFNIPFTFVIIWIAMVLILDMTFLGGFFFNFSYFFPLTSPIIRIIKSYGITFIILISNQLAAYLLICKRKYLYTLIVIIFTASTFLYTYNYSITHKNERKGRKKLTVALFQGNFRDTWEERVKNVYSILNKYIWMTKLAYSKKHFQLAIWPEYAIPGDPFESEVIYNKLSQLADQLNIYLVTGVAPWIKGHPRYKNYDTAIVFGPDGKLLGRYDSVMPLPYDYDVKAGNKKIIFDLPIGKFGVTLCYEEISYHINHYYISKGVDFLVIMTNHAYFDHTKGLYQASFLSRTRAAENDIYVLRTSNSGITQVVSPTGVVLAKLPKVTRDYLIFDIYIKNTK